MPPGCNNCCFVRCTVPLRWLKSCMIKSIIEGKAKQESTDTWTAYQEFIKKQGHIYKPAKSDKKVKHGIEKI